MSTTLKSVQETLSDQSLKPNHPTEFLVKVQQDLGPGFNVFSHVLSKAPK